MQLTITYYHRVLTFFTIFLICTSLYDLQDTNHRRNSMQKDFFEILMFRYPGGVAMIFQGARSQLLT